MKMVASKYFKMIDSIFDEVDKKKCLLKIIASNAVKTCFSILETRLHGVQRCNPIK
jgi:hypothetical protein